jgi:Site-specific recombinase XerD
MSRPRKKIILPKLNDCGGDLTKQWYIEYSVRNPKDDNMERFRIYEGFKDLKTAEERRVYAEREIKSYAEKLQDGWTPYDSDLYIFEDLLEYENVITHISGQKIKSTSYLHKLFSDYLINKRPEVNDKTFQNYKSKLAMFWAWLRTEGKGNMVPEMVDTDLIVDYLKSMANTKSLSRQSIKQYQMVLHNFFEYVRGKRIIRVNPVESIPRMGKVVDFAPYPIPKKDRATLSKYIKANDPQLWLACCLMYYTAIRPGEEIRRLKINHINLISRKIIIHSTTAKNNDTETIDMPEQLYVELIKYGVGDTDGSLFLFGKKGRPGEMPLGRNNLVNRFNDIRDHLKMPNSYKFYSWKHSGAEALADAGVDMWVIQAHLRHKSIETTEHYTRKRLGKRNDRIKNAFPDI